MFVLLFYSTDVNMFRLSKGVVTSTCAEWGVIGSLERPRLRGCFKPSKCELGRKIKQKSRLRVQNSN